MVWDCCLSEGLDWYLQPATLEMMQENWEGWNLHSRYQDMGWVHGERRGEWSGPAEEKSKGAETEWDENRENKEDFHKKDEVLLLGSRGWNQVEDWRDSSKDWLGCRSWWTSKGSIHLVTTRSVAHKRTMTGCGGGWGITKGEMGMEVDIMTN